MEAGVAVALITGISGVVIASISGFVSYKINQKVDELEDKVDKLTTENCHQQKMLRRLKAYLREWWEGIQSLLSQIGEAGLEPVWKPKQPPELDEEE
jgi:hypothetical protein